METWVAAWFLRFLEFMGVTIGGLFVAAFVLGIVMIDHRQSRKKIAAQDVKINKLYELTRKVERDHAAQDMRIDIHAQHFDVTDKDVERAKQASHKALKLCFNIVYGISFYFHWNGFKGFFNINICYALLYIFCLFLPFLPTRGIDKG